MSEPEPEPEPVEEGLYCSMCSERTPDNARIITMVWNGDVQFVCGSDCASNVLTMWSEAGLPVQ